MCILPNALTSVIPLQKLKLSVCTLANELTSFITSLFLKMRFSCLLISILELISSLNFSSFKYLIDIISVNS